MPPMATCSDQTGPAARLVRSKAYRKPFLLMPATMARLVASLNRIGESPQSESALAVLRGICQWSLMARVVASRATMASEVVWLAMFRVPVVT